MMLHSKYQASVPCGLRQEELFMFSLDISLCKTCDSLCAPNFGTRGII